MSPFSLVHLSNIFELLVTFDVDHLEEAYIVVRVEQL